MLIDFTWIDDPTKLTNDSLTPMTHLTYRLLHHRISPVLILRCWQRGDGQLVGPLFYDATKANKWMQANIANL